MVCEGGFDAIVGNPPYIRIQNMKQYSPKEVAYYQSETSPYTCARSHNFDKYNLFIERALSLLKPTGRLGYIIPHKFFTIRAGQALRQLLVSGKHLNEIVHFDVQQVFETRRTTYTCLLFLNKQSTPAFTVEHVSDLNRWRYGTPGSVEHYDARAVSDNSWEFVSPQLKTLFERLRAEKPTTLEQVAHIFVGVQTSDDKIYIIHPTVETETSATFTDIKGISWTLEKAILRPCLHDVELPPFTTPQPNTYIIFPYYIVESKALLYTPEEMQEQFPECWDYLCSHKDRLLSRSIQGYTEDTWYRYGRSQSLTKFNGEPKLIWPVLSVEPRYAYDAQDIVFTGGGNGPYYALRPLAETSLSLYYLQALLYHPVIEVMVRARGSVFRGGYTSHGKQFIKDLPIRTVDFSNPAEVADYNEIVRLVQQLITAKQRETQSTTPRQKNVFTKQASLLRKKIETIVAKLYQLTEDDVNVVSEFLSSDEGDAS